MKKRLVTDFDRLIIEAHKGMTSDEIAALDELEGKLRAAWERREEQKSGTLPREEKRRGAA